MIDALVEAHDGQSDLTHHLLRVIAYEVNGLRILYHTRNFKDPHPEPLVLRLPGDSEPKKPSLRDRARQLFAHG